MLESDDESSLLTALSKLGNLTAFKEFQVRMYTRNFWQARNSGT